MLPGATLRSKARPPGADPHLSGTSALPLGDADSVDYRISGTASVRQFLDHLPPAVTDVGARAARIALGSPRQMHHRPPLVLRQPVQDFLAQLPGSHGTNFPTCQYVTLGQLPLKLPF